MTDTSQMTVPSETETIQLLELLVTDVIASCPGVRSVAVILDWHGELNHTGAPVGIWNSASGPVTAQDTPTVQGAIGQTLKVFKSQSEALEANLELLQHYSATAFGEAEATQSRVNFEQATRQGQEDPDGEEGQTPQQQAETETEGHSEPSGHSGEAHTAAGD